MNTLYIEHENLAFLEDLIKKKEEVFMTELRSFDDFNMLKLYQHISSTMEDHANLRQLIFKLKRIVKSSATMATSLVLSEAIEKVVDETCECLDCDRASLFIYDTTKEELWTKVAKGSDEIIRVPLNKGIVGNQRSLHLLL